jgi:2-polyprenyl-6-methoxyphenol hydroxylase-like FAD-dependent oxidoreductase
MPETIRARCCIAGGGPAGMVLGLLLARGGVDVVVLEKHKDFLRDFRGDTVHPSTLEIMSELGLLDAFLKRPHQELREIAAVIGGVRAKIADFSHLPTRCKFIALMPQWDFLDFLASKAKQYHNFRLLMETEAVDLLHDAERVTDVAAQTADGALTITADLVVAADGRHSILRKKAALPLRQFGVPIDVLWMRLSKQPGEDLATLGRVGAGAIFVTLDRGDYWQCAFVIPKGGAEKLRQSGLESFRRLIARVAPAFAERTAEIADWDQVKLLTVAVDRLSQWYRPGLLCIGDCAHAMSPIGGVGINLAVQDAVAAANILGPSLLSGAPSIRELRNVQRRREGPAKLIQAVQRTVQNRIMTRVLKLEREPKPPAIVTLLDRFPILRRIPARLVGLGPRPEHVRFGRAGARPEHTQS